MKELDLWYAYNDLISEAALRDFHRNPILDCLFHHNKELKKIEEMRRKARRIWAEILFI